MKGVGDGIALLLAVARWSDLTSGHGLDVRTAGHLQWVLGTCQTRQAVNIFYIGTRAEAAWKQSEDRGWHNLALLNHLGDQLATFKLSSMCFRSQVTG
jgi:hypothetical protein